MARGMDRNTEYIYMVTFDHKDPDNMYWGSYAYGPYVNLGAARRLLKQEEGRWNQVNGKIMCTKVEWEEVK